MLAGFIGLCCMVALTCGWLARRTSLPVWLLVFLACSAPLGAFLVLQFGSRPTVSPYTFRVLGQYHQLADSVIAGSGPDADFVLPDSSAAAAQVVLRYDPAQNGVSVRVARSSAPVLFGGTPVNAVRIGRSAEVADSTGGTVSITRPWWCWYQCATRRIEYSTGGSVRQREASIDTTSTLAVGGARAVLFRVEKRDYVAADPSAGIEVDGRAIPSTIVAPGDTLRVGYPRAVALEVRPNIEQQRLEVRFARPLRDSWALEPDAGDTTRYLVAAAREGVIAGTTKLINPAVVAPGAAAVSYGGILEFTSQQWTWSSNADTRVLEPGRDELLPGPGRPTGHLISITQQDTEPTRGRTAATIAWIAGIALLAFVWRHLDPAGAGMRIMVAGLLYTLVLVRGALAFRAWLAPPNNASAAITFFALLIALPATIAAYHVWQDAAADNRRITVRRALPLMAPVIVQMVIALAAVLYAVAPEWRQPVVLAAVAPVIIGIVALAFLQRVLGHGAGVQRAAGPLGPLDPGHADRSTFRGFASAVAVLAILGLLIPVTTRLLQGGTALALIAWLAFAAVIALLGSSRHTVVRRRSPLARAVPSFALGAVSAIAAFGITRSTIAAAGAAVIVAACGWFWFGRRGPRIRPVHLKDLLPPAFLITLLLGAAIAIALGAIRPLAVAGEYAIALGGLIVFARIFAVLWFRVAERRQHQSTGRPHMQHTPLPGVWPVFVALICGAIIYAPLAADPGLLMLFLSAASLAAVVGMATLGRKGALAGVLTAIGLGMVFFLGMWVRPSTLASDQAAIGTPEIRYAAVYHPEALEARMLHARGSEPFVIVNTLQQYWGMRNYTALADTRGQGYFNTDFTNRGTTEAVALTDNAFSVFVLSEHGWIGGAAVLLCYLLLALALLNGALHASERRAQVPRGILLVGIAGFWMVPTLYLAAANGLLVPLTGQNIPMLGLLSSADIAMASWLGALGLVALPTMTAAGEEHIYAGAAVRSIRRAIRVMALVFGVVTLTVIVLLWGPTHGSFQDFRLDTLVAKVEELVARGAIITVEDSAGNSVIAAAPTAARLPAMQSGAFLERSIRRSNDIALNGRTGGNCYDADALLRTTTDGGIVVFPSLCRIQATTNGSFPWRGHLKLAGGRAELVVTDGRRAVIVADDAADSIAAIGAACASEGTARARTVRLGCADGAPTLHTGTRLYVLDSNGADTEVNGVKTGDLALVSPGDRIRVPGQLDVMTDTIPAGALAYARWINGSWRRLTPQAGSPLIAQVDTQIARGLAGRTHNLDDAVLTLDRNVHYALQERVSAACRSIPGARRCSITLANPSTGAIRALAQYPVNATPPRDLPADANLRNHPAASAVKPLLAAAALSAYPRLASLEVHHDASSYSSIANVQLSSPFDAHRIFPAVRVPFSAFLPASDNVFAASLGFLATAEPAGGGLPARSGNDNDARLTIGGQPFAGRPRWEQKEGRMAIGASPFARALEKLFDVHPTSTDVSPVDPRFWSRAVSAGLMNGGFDLQRITPEPVILRLDEVRSPRELATFMIGGGVDRWNNVAMVEALSRIHSGRAVNLHMLLSIGADTLTLPGDSLPAMSDVREPILDGMRATVREPWATAGALRSEFLPARVDWGAKTGTLRETEWTGSVFLFTGGPATRTAQTCAVAGIITIEFVRGSNPDGRATQLFRDIVAPLLRRELGWGDRPCATGG